MADCGTQESRHQINCIETFAMFSFVSQGRKYQANLTLSTSAMGKQTLLFLVSNLVCGRTSVKTGLKPLFIVWFKQLDHMILCLNKVLQGWIGKASFFFLVLCSYLEKQNKIHLFSKPSTVQLTQSTLFIIA